MIPTEDVISWDVESELIAAGVLAPKLVCVSYCDRTLVPGLLLWSESFEFLRDMLRNRKMVLQNGSFDCGVVAAQYPELLPNIFQAYFDGRIVDTRLNQRLIDLARGELEGWTNHHGVFIKRSYSLDGLSKFYGLGGLDKDTWRLRYAELRDIPVAQWPEGAREYAKLDAQRTLEVFYKQCEFEEFLQDAAAQARAAFALHLMSCRGLVTDGPAVRKFIAQTREEIERARVLLLEKGLVDSAGKRKTKLAKAHMEAVCHEIGIPVPKTKRSKDAGDNWEPSTCLDAEACRNTGDDVLKAYSTYTSANTLIKKAEILLKGSEGIPLQTSFETLLETGRTSSRAPMPPMVGDNFQNVRQAPGMREVFRPRPGYYLCSIDYDMAELRTVSQICLWVLGKSKLAEALNADQDVHSLLGAELMGVSYEDMLANKKHGEYKKNRGYGKMGNFSLWGGSGVPSFVTAVNKRAMTKEEKISVALGQKIKTSWQRTWPENYDYFKWIQQMLGTGAACYKSFISGRIRAGLDYTTAANNGFQSLAADAAKSALLPLAHECYVDTKSPLYGSRPLLFIHDECLLEICIERAHEAAMRARDIMVESFNKWVPDVPVTASPTLMTVWSKYATEMYDENKRLIAWTP